MYYSRVQTVILLYGINLVRGFFHSSPFKINFANDFCASYVMQVLPNDPTQWIEQRLDHFNDSDQRTWKMKYYKIMKSWTPEGPLLLFLQGAFGLPHLNTGITHLKDYDNDSEFFVDKIAEEMGAAYFMLEHRYYGESLPFADPTTKDLAFLTSRQALADAVHLLKTIKQTPEFQKSKVIVVGGAYAGNLATWMKRLYPELIDAVLASSAPVLIKKDFNQHYEAVTETFRTYGSQECVNKITKRFNIFHESFQSPEGIEKLKKENNICDDTDMTVPEAQQFFFLYQIYFSFGQYAEYGTPAEIAARCHNIMSSELEHRIPYVKNDGPGNDCYDYDHKDWLSGEYHFIFVRLWWYQTCTEFGYFETTSSSEQNMFGMCIPADFHYKSCKFLFGETFNEQRLDQTIINNNRMYGGLTPNVTNVVFVNGDMDPWHRLGVVHDLSADAPAIVIKGAGHCSEFYPEINNSDNVKAARREIINLLKKWIGQA